MSATFMLAISIRQPFAELILRGIKTIEYRSRPTKIIGERFYIYAAKAKAKLPIWSEDLQIGTPPVWMIELARHIKLIDPDEELPTGVIVGSAVIGEVIPPDDDSDLFRWELTDVRRFRTPRKPIGHPQPVWWRPV